MKLFLLGWIKYKNDEIKTEKKLETIPAKKTTRDISTTKKKIIEKMNSVLLINVYVPLCSIL